MQVAFASVPDQTRKSLMNVEARAIDEYVIKYVQTYACGILDEQALIYDLCRLTFRTRIPLHVSS